MMLTIHNALDITLPLEDPILKFMLILSIILAAPLILNKLRIPYLLGLIIAGAIIGPHGLNLVLRDSSIILSGTAGLLYIMFLSGLDMDMSDFRRNSWKSLVFGLYTFTIPMAMGIVAGYYILGFSIYSSILLAGLFASQTLIAYPIISKLGITRDKAVNLTAGGTIITDTLALLNLTIIVGLATGNTDEGFWYRLSGSIILCIAIIMLLFPLLGRWFFKRCSDSVSQYIFVLVMVFLGSYLAQWAGLEPIIGAFLSGLAMNRLVPRTSPLMNRIEFVGNAIFIPFFLIGVGMLIDYRAFFKSWETIEVSIVMIVMVTAAKYLAAYFTQKTFKLSVDQRTVIFGLSSAHVAATLAAVMVGYNVILGHTVDGEPIRLLSESVLNGTILMILVTCTVSTFATQKGAHNIAIKGSPDDKKETDEEHILISVSNEHTVCELVNLCMAMKSDKNRTGMYALNAIDNQTENPEVQKRARKVLDIAINTAAASDNYMHEMLRYDVNIVNAVVSVIKERSITDLVIGLHKEEHGTPASTLGKITSEVIGHSNVTSFVYRPLQPLGTVRRHLVIIPANAEKEAGFGHWLAKIWNIAKNTGSKTVFYTNDNTMKYLKAACKKRPIDAEFAAFENWDAFAELSGSVRTDDCLWIVMSRRDRVSYTPAMSRVSGLLEQYFCNNSLVLLYPIQAGAPESRYMETLS